jgi:2-methylisocitrate lyase-like PEP mutase family enzyme
MVGIKGKSFSLSELAAAGVRRISLATTPYRLAMTGFVESMREIKQTGSFDVVDRILSTADLNQLMGI